MKSCRQHSRSLWFAVLVAAAALSACTDEPPPALGTLEYDRITLPAPVAERIVAVDVHEGEQVRAGQPLLQLDDAHLRAQWSAAQAQVRQQRELLDELVRGPRREDIARARAELATVEARAREARVYLARVRPLESANAAAAADVDRARAAAGEASGQVEAARAALDELLHGTRPERIAQARAALAAAEAQARAAQVQLARLDVLAPRAGRVDQLPYRLGDQAPVGAPLAILLVGAEPYARIYVSERQRAQVHVGDRVRVFVDGRHGALAGRIRMVRSEPSFTPYYALSGSDAMRLSYLAEVTLGRDAANLPAGLPVRVQLAGGTR